MRALVLASLLAVPMAAQAAPEPDAASARAFLQSIYRHYGKTGLGAPMERPERWFEPVLARAIRADHAESERTGDVGKLDGDPFCNCQDFGALAATIGPVAIAGDRATVTVGFVNGQPVSMTYTLVRTRNGWRIFDIAWEEASLRALFVPG